ncbi:MAG: hypothetical protein KBD66_03760, partial [Candidatus Doudnabacteria bacterium]|nr:hypothetical protein [Candidatus Doudnabacteria bacterium]
MKYRFFVMVAMLALLPGQVLAAANPGYIGPPIQEGVLTISSLSKTLNGRVGAYFSAHFKVSGGTAPYAWQSQYLPAGLSLSVNPSAVTNCAEPAEELLTIGYTCPSPFSTGEDITIAGTPVEAGVTTIVLSVSDSGGKTAKHSFSLVISSVSSSAMAVSGTNYATGSVGNNFASTFTVAGGTAPYAWTVVRGQLPPGLLPSFGAFNCITTPCVNPKDTMYLMGTPTNAGVFTYTVVATDSTGVGAVQEFTTTISGNSTTDAIVVTNPTAGQVWTMGQRYTIRWANTTTGPRVYPVSLYIAPPRPACLDAVPACKIAEPAPYIIASNISDSGAYEWLVPTDLPERYQGGQQITVAASNSAVVGRSGQFTIQKQSTVHNGPITITSPSAGVRWEVGKRYDISWSGHNNLAVKVSLQPQYKCPSGQYCPAVMPKALTIVPAFEGTSYSWVVPDTLEGQKLEGEYYITLETVAAGVDYILWGQSDTFTIVPAGGAPNPNVLVSASVVRTPDKAVHLVLDGGKYYTFPTWEEFLRRGYVFQHIRAVGQTALQGLVQTTAFQRPSGTTFKYPTD